MSFGRLSLYPEEYYTLPEYDQLKDFIKSDHRVGYVMFYVQLRDAPKDPISIARSIEKGERNIKVEESFWNIMFNTPYKDLPLFVNDGYLSPIVQWRLSINK